jgi:hypothetical protein
MASKPFSPLSSAFVAAIMLFITQSTVAQYSRRSSGEMSSWQIGFTAGASKFQTSINPNSDAVYKKLNYWNSDFNAAISLSVIKTISPKFSTEFEFMTTKLSGSWNASSGFPHPAAVGNVVPKPFKTGINQLNLVLIANLNQIVAPNSASDTWYLFIKGGGGASFLKAYSSVFPFSNEFKYSILYGGGLSYKINDQIDLKLGTTWYRVETDRLDGLHTAKPGGGIGNAGYYFNIKERYIYPYIGMTYGFGQARTSAKGSKAKSRRSIWKRISKDNSRSNWTKPPSKKNKYRKKSNFISRLFKN